MVGGQDLAAAANTFNNLSIPPSLMRANDCVAVSGARQGRLVDIACDTPPPGLKIALRAWSEEGLRRQRTSVLRVARRLPARSFVRMHAYAAACARGELLTSHLRCADEVSGTVQTLPGSGPSGHPLLLTWPAAGIRSARHQDCRLRTAATCGLETTPFAKSLQSSGIVAARRR